jgi:hypothetical protein
MLLAVAALTRGGRAVAAHAARPRPGIEANRTVA